MQGREAAGPNRSLRLDAASLHRMSPMPAVSRRQCLASFLGLSVLAGLLLVTGGRCGGADPSAAGSARLVVPQLVMPRLAMPGRPHVGPLPQATESQIRLARSLRADVTTLAETIGERHADPFHAAALGRAEAFLHTSLVAAGLAVERQAYELRGLTVANLIAEIRGTANRGQQADEIIVVGAHYDSAADTPGANDNASGVAATLALARAFAATTPSRTLRFVFFVNEEPPWFQTDDMGSVRYAKRCRERKERIAAMLSIETIGYFSDDPGSQRFDSLPPLRLLYPDRGNFIAFVGNVASGELVSRTVGKFRDTTPFPAYGCGLPDVVAGVGWSDHWAFWQAGYPAVMVTDTAVFRYPHYHAPEDTPDKLDFDRIARVVGGLARVIADLADVAAPEAL
jgi:hypothetical protein